MVLAYVLWLQNGTVRWRSRTDAPHRVVASGKENARIVCSSLVKQSLCNSRKSCLRLTVQQVWLSAMVTTELTTCQCLMGKDTLCSCVHMNDLPVAHRHVPVCTDAAVPFLSTNRFQGPYFTPVLCTHCTIKTSEFFSESGVSVA